MIDNVLKFTAGEVNKYVIRKIDPALDPSITKWVELGNVTTVINGEEDAGDLKGKAILTLVNIEEDKVSKLPNNISRKNDLIEYRNPKMFLNLYCLFSVSNKDYEKGLEQLSYIIQFFQNKNVITQKDNPSANPALDAGVDKIIFDLVTLSFEQLNHLWGILGAKYLPSVLYKMRLIAIEDGTPDGQALPILKVRNVNTSITQ